MTYRFARILFAVGMTFIGGCMAPEEDNGEVVFEFDKARISAAKNATPSSFHVRGRMENGKFTPKGEIIGDGNLDVKGRAGWMELSSGKFFPFHAAKSPISPYVKGHMTDHGFVPSSREIH